MTDEAKPAEEVNKDIPKEFHGVVEKYGRPMFTMVFNAGMCSQATQVLAQFAEKHRSQHSLHAVSVLSNAFNQLATEYCKKMEWDEGILAQCDRDIGLAFRSKIITPVSKIILDS